MLSTPKVKENGSTFSSLKKPVDIMLAQVDRLVENAKFSQSFDTLKLLLESILTSKKNLYK